MINRIHRDENLSVWFIFHLSGEEIRTLGENLFKTVAANDIEYVEQMGPFQPWERISPSVKI